MSLFRKRNAVPRLAVLYGMVEQLRSLEVRAAAVLLDDAVRDAAVEQAIRDEQQKRGRSALEGADREAWKVAETTLAVAERRIARLVELRAERERALQRAKLAHREIWTERERMERVRRRKHDAAHVEETRRMQAESDDRYGSRLLWNRLNEEPG